MKQKNIKKKKKKFTLARVRETIIAEDAELARKQQADYDAEYLAEINRPITKKSMTIAQERNWMISFLKGRGYNNLQRLRYPKVKALWEQVQESIRKEVENFVPMDVDREKKLEEVRKEQA